MTVKEIQKKIEDLQAMLKTEENNVAKMEGRLQELESQLDKEFKVKTAEEIAALVAQFEAELKTLGEEKAHIVQELDATLARVNQQ